MGGSVNLLMKAGEVAKVRRCLSGKNLCAPPLEGQRYGVGCSVTFSGNRVSIKYSFGQAHNREWAQAVAGAILSRFEALNAGWDAIGYVGVGVVRQSRPYETYLERGCVNWWSRILVGYTKRKLLVWRRAYEEAAAKLVGQV